MPTTTIFISYRREDTVGHAGRLFDRLAERFGRGNVYRDIDTIAAGEDFVEAVRKKINRSDVLLALIGPRWLTAVDEAGRRRLADENDLVRVEIALALKRNIRVIPVLMQGATMPRTNDLPGELAQLAQRNAVEIRDTGFEQDVAQLFTVLEPTWRRKLIRIVARQPVYAGLIAVAVIILGLWAYPQIAGTQEGARIQIVQMGMAFDADTFVRRAENGDAQAVNLFLQGGMAPDAKNQQGETALMWAAAKGNLALVKKLIGQGVDEDEAMVWSVDRDQRDVFSFLLARQPSKNAINTALLSAAGKGDTAIVQTLLDKGADVNFKGKRDNFALYNASGNRSNNPETVRLLLSRGANVNAKTDDNCTALHSAVGRHRSFGGGEQDGVQMEIVDALLSKGADINARCQSNMYGQPTPLLLAIKEGYPLIALRLIEQGADVNGQIRSEHYYLTALMVAAMESLPDVVHALLAKGMDVNARNEAGETALMRCVNDWDRDQPTIAQALIASGADVNATDKDGWTALMSAAWYGRSNVARVLLRHGARVTARNHGGRNALMIATKKGNKEMVKLLGGRSAIENTLHK